MDIYENMKEQINQDLRDSIINVMDKKNIPYNLDGSESKDKRLTLFVTNCDISLPKKLRTKHRLANPVVDIVFTALECFDYDIANDLHTNKEYPITKLIYLYAILEDPSWQIEMVRYITAWSKAIFSSLMLKYQEKYGIKLARMPFEIWLESPEKMYVTKTPCFEDLIFVSDDSSHKKVETSTIIKEQADLIESMRGSGFFKK